MIDDLAALAARIDALHAEQNPDDLSHVLRDAFTQDMIFKLHVLPLVGDIERAKALLEIFDKVCSATYTVSRIDSEAQGRCMTQALQATKSDDGLQAISATLRLDGASAYLLHHPRKTHPTND